MVENYNMNSYYIECFNLYFCELYFCNVKSDAKDTKYLPLDLESIVNAKHNHKIIMS